jgi:hypothetical protein
MFLLIVKLTLTPILMWFVSAAGRRWGTLIGGLLAGMPITSVPISIYLYAEQGQNFAREAAASSLSGVGAVALFSLVYATLAKRIPPFLTVLASLAGFVGGLFFLAHFDFWPVFISDIALIFLILRLTPDQGCPTGSMIYPVWDMPVRMITSTGLVLFVTLGGRMFGPSLSGFLAPIPVIAWPLIVFAHVHEGFPGALAALRGNLQGAYGVATFYVLIAILLPITNPFVSYLLAIAGSILCTLPFFLIRKRRGAVAPVFTTHDV